MLHVTRHCIWLAFVCQMHTLLYNLDTCVGRPLSAAWGGWTMQVHSCVLDSIDHHDRSSCATGKLTLHLYFM